VAPPAECLDVTVSLVTVCHGSSSVAGGCVDSFRRELALSGRTGEVVAVEQSENVDELDGVRALGPDRLVERPNRGYAAGLNAGVAVATGDVLVLANPDLELLPGSLGRLLDALESGFEVVGPRIVWDHDAVLSYPPAEDPEPVAEIRRIARRRWQGVWERGLEPELESCWRAWSARGPLEVPALRGPLLVVRRATWELLGPFDEGYFLYSEETEWLWRARRRGARLGYVASAPVVHRGGHATERLPDREAIEARSRERYFARNWPAVWRWVARGLEPGEDRTGLVEADEVSGATACRADGADLWLLAPWRRLTPAGGCLGGSELPKAARAASAAGRWYALAAARDQARWRTLGRWTWTS
jgi:GT2 family glycosyltransferase